MQVGTHSDALNQSLPGAEKIYTAPENSGLVVLGRSLVSLLEEAVKNYPNPSAFNQRKETGWQSLSNTEFLQRAEYLALAFHDLGLSKGERVAFYTHSDLSFCLPDMACLIAGLVDVPIYLTHPASAIRHILQESEAKALLVSDLKLLEEIRPVLTEVPALKYIILVETGSEQPNLPELLSMTELEQRGQAIYEKDSEKIKLLKASIRATDLATLLYTSGTTGMPKGVMLTHENISSNVIAALSGMTSLQKGQAETAISFLPLTHIFARALHSGLMWYGISVYFSDPERLREDLKEVRPTYFAAVPRVLEKAFERILATGSSLSGLKRNLFDWSMELARQYDVSKEASGFFALQLKIADRLVFSKWREALGGRIQHISVGGAALRADLTNAFGAAGINLLQGYGLTETSPVVSFNRSGRNKAGTVGEVLAGVEVKLSPEKEIWVRGPNIMQGYYKNPEQTAEVLQDGWFRTGDLGEFSEDGYLKITGRLKNLFKLSTGKYVMPQPLEERLEAEPLISHALVLGENEKYCAALVFINKEMFKSDDPVALKQSEVDDQLKAMLQRTNEDMPPWSSLKKVALILDELTIDNNMLTPKMSVKRNLVIEKYQDYIDALFDRHDAELSRGIILDI